MADNIVPGRIVYFVFDEQSAAEVMRRRTTSASIVDRMKSKIVNPQGGVDIAAWPAGAQAHIGNDVKAGDVYPAMILRVLGSGGCSNLKVMVVGSDDYWATSVNYDGGHDTEDIPQTDAREQIYQPRTWHWIFQGQDKRYDPATVKA